MAAKKNAGGVRRPSPSAKSKIPWALLVAAVKSRFKSDREVDVGEYPVRGKLTLALDCTVQRLPNTTETPPYKPDWIVLLAILLEEKEVDLDDVALLLDEVEEKAAEELADDTYVDAVKAALERQAARWKAKQENWPKNGATKVAGSVEVIDWKPG